MRDVVRQLIGALEQGREQIVCQVVETRGSTPQKAGALMVVDPDGGQAGTLGGGCVEAEVKQRAIRRIGQNGACLNSFVLDHDYAWADGLICGGKMVVVTEAVRGEGPLCYFRALHALLDSGEGFTETIVVDAEKAGTAIGTRGLFDHQRELVAAWPDGALTNDFGERVTDLAERPKPNLRAGVALLPTLPRVRLLIVGGGHVGQAVAGLAAQADFDIWVVDDRHQYANAERFPSARKILVGPLDGLRDPPVTAQTYALIVTRGHGHDQEALYYLAPTAAPYVGLIGSRRKIRMIFENLQEMGIPAAALARVSAPVGFDIGSQTVPEIAISIVAELIARRNLGARTPATHERRSERGRGACPIGPRMIAAIVPAAGRSERMGRPKLILTIRGTTVITRVVTALRQGGADPIVVVAPPANAPGAAAVTEEAENAGAKVVVPADHPIDMRASFELGLCELERASPPRFILLAPADNAGITRELVATVIERATTEALAIIIPTVKGRRGHPIAVSWELAVMSRSLPLGAGLNALVALHADRVIELEVAEPGALIDLDTPEDYERWIEADTM